MLIRLTGLGKVVVRMTIIVCLDNNNGMLFNHRRQSRDANVIKDIKGTVGDSIVFANSYSEPLFAGAKVKLKIADDFLSAAENNDFCFVENTSGKIYEDWITKLIIYKWNRDYPSDFRFDIDYGKNFKLKSSVDFIETSHEKITKEVYVR